MRNSWRNTGLIAGLALLALSMQTRAQTAEGAHTDLYDFSTLMLQADTRCRSMGWFEQKYVQTLRGDAYSGSRFSKLKGREAEQAYLSALMKVANTLDCAGKEFQTIRARAMWDLAATLQSASDMRAASPPIFGLEPLKPFERDLRDVFMKELERQAGANWPQLKAEIAKEAQKRVADAKAKEARAKEATAKDPKTAPRVSGIFDDLRQKTAFDRMHFFYFVSNTLRMQPRQVLSGTSLMTVLEGAGTRIQLPVLAEPQRVSIPTADGGVRAAATFVILEQDAGLLVGVHGADAEQLASDPHLRADLKENSEVFPLTRDRSQCMQMICFRMKKADVQTIFAKSGKNWLMVNLTALPPGTKPEKAAVVTLYEGPRTMAMRFLQRP